MLVTCSISGWYGGVMVAMGLISKWYFSQMISYGLNSWVPLTDIVVWWWS